MDNLTIFDFMYEKYKLTKPIRLIELFAGYGSQALALKYLNIPFEHHLVCELDKYAMQSYNDIHNTNFEPSDITKLESLNIVDTNKYNYILTYSFPCSLAGYKVKVQNGYKNIENICVGDYVLTHNNKYQKVKRTMNRKKQGYYEIKYLGGILELTDNHPLYVYRDNKFQWIKVKDLKISDMLTFNVDEQSIDRQDISNEMLWLLGRYVADGWHNKYLYNSISFAIANQKESYFLEKAPKYLTNKAKVYNKSCLEYRIADRGLKELCLQFGNGAKNKKIPKWVLELPKIKLQYFLNGYLSGDGFERTQSGSKEIMFSTVSKELFLGIQDIMIKLYGRVCSMYVRKDNRKETFNDTYNGQLILTKDTKKQFKIKDKICVKINAIKFIDELVDVYNIEVEEDESYTLNNVIVHNCTDLSLAGKQKGMEKGSNTRSSLLWEVKRLLNECKELPQVLLMENVPQVLKAKGWLEWYSYLESKGYKNYCNILSSKNYGIPQKRERCFMVSILGNYTYQYPKKTTLKTSVKDYLEDNVTKSKFFLSEKNKDYILDIKGVRGGIQGSIVNPNIAKTISCRGACEQRAHITNFVILNRDKEMTISECIECKSELNIRKLTPRECLRLMGVKDEDIDKMTVSDTQKYKQAGNSIVVNVLMAIFNEMR